MIREATHEDAEEIVSLGRRFVNESGVSWVGYDERDAMAYLGEFLGAPNKIVLVMIRDKKVVGFFFGRVVPFLFNSRLLLAEEELWYVAPESRGGFGAAALLRRFERWATDKGAARISIGNTVEIAEDRYGQLVTRLGYTPYGRTYRKEVS